MTDIDNISPAPWCRGEWHGSLVSVDGTSADDFTRDDVSAVVAWGTTPQCDWDGETAGIAVLNDGRFIAWEANWYPTGSGFSADAYGGESNIFFAASASAARSALSERAHELPDKEKP